MKKLVVVATLTIWPPAYGMNNAQRVEAIKDIGQSSLPEERHPLRTQAKIFI